MNDGPAGLPLICPIWRGGGGGAGFIIVFILHVIACETFIMTWTLNWKGKMCMKARRDEARRKHHWTSLTGNVAGDVMRTDLRFTAPPPPRTTLFLAAAAAAAFEIQLPPYVTSDGRPRTVCFVAGARVYVQHVLLIDRVTSIVSLSVLS